MRLVDPASAKRIHPNDPQRIQRALEVFHITGRPLTELWTEGEAQAPSCRFVRLVLSPESREILHERIALRFRTMLAMGLVEEVNKLYTRGDLNASMPSIRAVGYRQVWSYLQGDWDHATMTEKAITATRQFAKRQFTWLRRETDARHYSSCDTVTRQILADLDQDLRLA